MFRIAVALLVLGIGGIAVAQQKMPFKLKKRSKGSDYQMFAVTAPFGVIGGEMGLHIEANLAGNASLALEGIYVPEREEFAEKRVEEDKRSFIGGGYEAALIITRFTREMDMAGFYWSMGVGYRQINGTYRHPAEGKGYALVDRSNRDEEGRIAQEANAAGITGRGRVGYRYLGDSFPFVIGAFFGIRHFENKVAAKSTDETQQLSDEDSHQLSNMLTTAPEGAIEIGLSF